MKLSDFDYALPDGRIARVPIEPRDRARLLVHSLVDQSTEHAEIAALDRYLRRGDLLVVNDTRVRQARFLGRRPSGGAVELLLLECFDDGTWRALAQPAARLKPGQVLELAEGRLCARLLRRPQDSSGRSLPEWHLELFDPRDGTPASEALLEALGRAPLPPYIARSRAPGDSGADDRRRYQTMFARELGAIAAPTAGLHFTPELLERLASAEIELVRLTLHVGEGTFRPVTEADPSRHVMHAERFHLPPQTARAIERCRERGGRVVAVGTTSCRVLETQALEDGRVTSASGETRLFILPGFHFRVVDALLTNFHLPQSTLLMLVCAFIGRERALSLYREAIARDYRFFSYGDAMLLLRR